MDWLVTNLNIEELITVTVQYIPRAVAALLILVVFWVVYRLTRVPVAAVKSPSDRPKPNVSSTAAPTTRNAISPVGTNR